MSDLFNYRNTNLIGSVIEGYEYNFSKEEVDVTSSIFYIIDKTELLVKGNTIKTEVYVVVLIDPAYTTYTSIDSSNLRLTSITYVTTDSIIEIKEFPKTTPLVSIENGLMGANIKGYEYNPSKQESDVTLVTCKIVDKIKILISDVLTDVYVCVLYSGTTGSNKLYVPFTSVVEIVSFGLIDYGRPSVLRYTGMNFKKDSTGITILFLDSTTGNILREEPINTIQAVNTPPSTDIVIQRTGGQEIIIQALELAVTQINGVVAGATIADAVNNLNSLFILTTGEIGKLPTITSGDILLTAGNPINYFVTGDNIASVDYDLTGLPAATLTQPLYNQFNLIGGTLLPVGSYTFTVHCFNYWGQTSKVINITVSSSYSNTYSYEGNSLSYMQKTAVGSENDTPLYRASGPTGPAWTLFGWMKSDNSSGAWRALLHFGDYPSGVGGSDAGRVQFRCRTSGGTIRILFTYGGYSSNSINSGQINTGVAQNVWFSYMIVYDGTTTNNSLATNPFSIYVNGVLTSPSWAVSGTGYAGSVEYMPLLTYPDRSQFNLGKTTAYSTIIYAPDVYQDEMALWQSDQSANAATFHNAGTPIDLASYNPYAYYRFGDAPTDISGFPVMEDIGTTGTDLTMFNGNVGLYVSDVP